MNNDQIRKLALDNGFKLKQQPNGDEDLNPYVYDFARALLSQASEEQQQAQRKNGDEAFTEHLRNAEKTISNGAQITKHRIDLGE